MDLLDLHVHRLQKSPRVRQRSESNSKLDGCTAAFLGFEKEKKTRPGSRRRARRVVRGEGGEGGAKSGVFYF